ncbi:adenosylcobinamide-phosphate synthase CbiB [Roseibium sediminicola]|uniref:Cobalamin biosynthesis protein CobD n=1 Tax=Roseibium sediminicola TaxID=2933272 RepID=A0ABT0GRW2_9HYPH|nr:adenosylcobinamide-phosphate synthase CbiB [Roseibium sp. CAU 1639]MCK7611548.1 adenosylcobinamide-phosphate synthase CbiB [Roseibium sp. CAU 1639]
MILYDHALWLLLAALIVDALIGDPDWLWHRLPHPVVWIGKLIALFDRLFNKTDYAPGTRKLGGVLTLLALVLGAAGIGAGIEALADKLPYGKILIVLIAAVFLAQNSLYRHVAAVRDGLLKDGLEGGRKAVSMIVGRDPKQLDEAGVSRAAIESCAENYSDGIVAPLVWFALLGLPGLIAYKAVNTADSMIGHKNEVYADFGWASARFDDLINLPASRLAGLLIALSAPLAGGSPRKSIACVLDDARKHRSPNAGWPEAAMAGALGLALAGPRIYPGYTVNDRYLNAKGRKDAKAEDIARALRVLIGCYALQVVVVTALAAFGTA